MQIVIDIHERDYQSMLNGLVSYSVLDAIRNGTPLPKGHGRLGDLDELEQRISNFVEHDAKTTDEYTVVRQRFIVDGIRETSTIIEADKAESEVQE